MEILPQDNNSKAFFKAISDLDSNRAEVKAKLVARQVATAQGVYSARKKEFKKAQKVLAKMEKALTKYKESGKMKHIEKVFGEV